MKWFTATAATIAVTATALTGGAANAAATSNRYDRSELQNDLDAIHATGVSGVLAEGCPSTTPSSAGCPGVVTGNGNNGAAVTVRQLLQHTSGIYDYADDLTAQIGSVDDFQKFRFASYTPQQLVAMAMAHRPDFAPGRGWNYSNTNYTLIGMIIKKVTGRDWATEVTDRIIRPLGLRHTFAPGTGTRLPEPHASAYLYLDRDTPIETADANLTLAGSADALVTTAADLSRFWAAIGRTTVVISISTSADTPVDQAAYGMIDHALCSRG